MMNNTGLPISQAGMSAREAGLMASVLLFSFLLFQLELTLLFGISLRFAGLSAFGFQFLPLHLQCLL